MRDEFKTSGPKTKTYMTTDTKKVTLGNFRNLITSQKTFVLLVYKHNFVSQLTMYFISHHHHVPKGLGVFPVP